jgi:hypothetical protein
MVSTAAASVALGGVAPTEPAAAATSDVGRPPCSSAPLASVAPLPPKADVSADAGSGTKSLCEGRGVRPW